MKLFAGSSIFTPPILSAKCAIVALLYTHTAFAQGFSQLATNRDGSILYFSSPLRIKGTDQYFHPKIFTWDGVNGVRLYKQRKSDVPFPTSNFGFIGGDFFSLVAPDLSSDASTLAITGIRFCNFSDVCVLSLEEYQSTIYTAGQPTITTSGSATLSRNGRYALLTSSIDRQVLPSQMQLVDLQTGQQTQYAGGLPGSRAQPGATHQVANDGTVVIGGSSISVGQGGQLRTIVPSTSTVAHSLINDSGTLVIYQAGAGQVSEPVRLSAYSVPAGSSIDLVTDTAGSSFAASISDDGAQIAFLYGQNRQVYVIRRDGTGLRQITNFPEAVTEIALSGDGSLAFAVTAANRIVRIDIASAQSTDIVPPTPYVNVDRMQVSRGSVTQVAGSGFAPDTEDALPPFPLAVGGVELHVGGSPVPIAGVSPKSISYPASWDLPDSSVEVEVSVSSASASLFIPGFEVEPNPPGFYLVSQPGGPFMLIAVHQDYASLISPASPAQPEEIVHVYAKDLGPVNPAPPVGLPAPLSPLSLLTPPMSCTLQADPNPGDPVDVLFAGLAPELLNVFQVDVRLPVSFRANPSALRCYIGDPALGYFIGGYLAVMGPS